MAGGLTFASIVAELQMTGKLGWGPSAVIGGQRVTGMRARPFPKSFVTLFGTQGRIPVRVPREDVGGHRQEESRAAARAVQRSRCAMRTSTVPASSSMRREACVLVSFSTISLCSVSTTGLRS